MSSQAGRGGELLGERPHPAAPGERTAVDRGADELAGEQGVAQRAGPQEVEDLAVDRPAQRLAHQPVENGPPERLQVEPFAQPVLPQPDDRVGDVLATPHRGQHPQAVLGRELVHECGRGLVQRVGIVDGEHRGLAGEDGLRAGPGRPPRRRWAAAGRRRRGNDAGRPRRPHPQGAQARVLGPLDRLGQQAGLADAGLAGQHDTARGAARASAALELPLAPDEGPSGLQPATSSPVAHAT